VPPRCLIPHFPDDPKSRFLDELDDEMSRSQAKASGEWKTVKSLDVFWEMMAFRQECSAGRMVGFIWVVFTPEIVDDVGEPPASQASIQSSVMDDTHDPTRRYNFEGQDSFTPNTSFTTSVATTSPVKSRDREFRESSSSSTAKRKKN